MRENLENAREWLAGQRNRCQQPNKPAEVVPDLVPLTARYDPNAHQVYFNAIEKALKQRQLVKNIALTGAYGVGKSSILQEVTRVHRKRTISLSLSTLGLAGYSKSGAELTKRNSLKNSDPQSKTNQIQKEIVKQLLYSQDPIRMSGSRFGRMTRFRPWRSVLLSMAAALVVGVVFALTGWSAHLAKISAIPHDWLWTANPAVFLVATLIVLLVLWLSNNRVQVSQVGAGTASIALSPKSSTYFDQYLDEIVYFFEVVKKDIVIFEDIDRFDDPHIFETLRSLNTLLNGAKQLGRRKIRFIYAIKDSIFEELGAVAGEEALSSEDPDGETREQKLPDSNATADPVSDQLARSNRTKFFDLVIPVVPFITHRSARNLLAMTAAGLQPPIAVDLIDLAARHIADMRLILDIRNEYTIFKSRVIDGSTLDLDPDVLFAMVLYKVTHLSDFELIRLGSSDLDKLDQDRIELIDQNIEGLNERIRDTQSQLSRLKSVRARGASLGNSLLSALKQGAADFGLIIAGYAYQGSDRTEADLLSDEFWESFVATDQPLIISYSRPGWGGQTHPLSRAQVAERVRDSLNTDAWIVTERKRLEQQLASTNEEIDFLAHADFGDLMGRPDFLLTRGETNKTFEECARERLQSELALQLITAGKIDRNFTLYTSTFYAKRVSANATNFIIKNVDPNVVSVNFPLDDADVEAVLREKGDGVLDQRVAFNLSIVDYLLRIEPARLQRVLRQIGAGAAAGRSLLDAYFARGKQTALLVRTLTPLWDQTITYLASEAKLDDALRLELVDNALRSLSSKHHYATSDKVKQFLGEHYLELSTFTSDDVSAEQAELVAHFVERAGVLLSDLSPLSSIMLRKIVDCRAYLLTRANLTTALGDEGASVALDSLEHADEEVYEHSVHNLSAYRESLKLGEPTIESNDEFIGVVEHVMEIDPDELDWVVQTADESCVVDNLGDVVDDSWQLLAKHLRFAASMSNVEVYLARYGMDEPLAALLEDIGRLSVETTDTEASKQRLASTILTASNFIPSPEIRVALVASLVTNTPIPPSVIPVETGNLVGLLIGEGLIADGPTSFAALDPLDVDALAYAISRSDQFVTFMTPTEVRVGDVGKLVDNPLVPDTVKIQLISRLDEFATAAQLTELDSVARYAASHELSVSFANVQRLAENGVDARWVAPLLQPHLPSVALIDLSPVLTALGGNYARLTQRNGNRRDLDDTAANRALVERLRDFDLIANAPIENGLIHVRMRPRR
jgi:hypothetical protein